jgi:hypothetical protein
MCQRARHVLRQIMDAIRVYMVDRGAAQTSHPMRGKCHYQKTGQVSSVPSFVQLVDSSE